MAGFSTYLGNAIFNATFAPATGQASITAKTAVYLSLHTAVPSDATGGSETTYTNYVRQSIGALMTAANQTESGGEQVVRASNTLGAITFPASATVADVTVTHWAIYDAVSSGNLLYSGAFTASRTIQTGDIPTISTGELKIDLT